MPTITTLAESDVLDKLYTWLPITCVLKLASVEVDVIVIPITPELAPLLVLRELVVMFRMMLLVITGIPLEDVIPIIWPAAARVVMRTFSMRFCEILLRMNEEFSRPNIVQVPVDP